MFDTLVDISTLARHLHDPHWVIVDCRFQLGDAGAGRRMYAQGHIPGARYAHLDDDLSSPITPTSGRHPLPAPEEMAARLRAWGVNADTQVVCYDDAGGAIAGRLWWLLRWLGHSAAALLDGGIQAWQEAGGQLESVAPDIRPGNFVARPNATLGLSTEEVEAIVSGKREGCLLDARGAPRYRGEEEPLDRVAGHIPGSLNLPFPGNLGPDGRFLAPAVLRERFRAVLGDRAPAEVVHSCGSGVTACNNMLAMEVAGLKGSRLYPGSWSEWITDGTRPVARGDKA